VEKRPPSEPDFATPLHSPVPSIMLVELGEPVRSWCAAAAPGVLILSVAHLPAARERALVTRPLVIVIPDRDQDAVDLADVVQSIGAELLRFLEASGQDYFVRRVGEALAEATGRRRAPF
jgi:hypothetical protein